MDEKLRIGIFGGTFNPFHNGHLMCAQSVLDEFSLSKILFVPSRIPVHKKLSCGVSGEDRSSIIRFSIKGNPHFELCDDEIVRKEKSYSYITVERIMNVYPGAELFFILGVDSFNSLASWKNPESLKRNVAFIVLKRDGQIINKKLANWAGNVLLSSNTEVSISSSELRKKIGDAEFLRCNMNSDAVEYILRKRLYCAE